MKSFEIVTLTVNPSIDKSTKFSGLVAEQKIRCEMPHYDAGGGGINVSKAILRLEGESLCVFTSGGPMGKMLENLVEEQGIAMKIIPVKNWTRESLEAVDLQTNQQYRFGFPGAPLSIEEKNQVIETVSNLKTKYIVASGSLNEELETDFYAKIAELCKNSGAKFILDTSGEALEKALAVGVYLVKPNIGELAKLVGADTLSNDDAVDAAKTIIKKGNAEIVAISLGPKGAILVTENETHQVEAPKVEKKSTVGAGDSMVGGMVWALAKGKSMEEVIQWGVACGSAATMNEGTQLFKKEAAEKLFKMISKK